MTYKICYKKESNLSSKSKYGESSMSSFLVYEPILTSIALTTFVWFMQLIWWRHLVLFLLWSFYTTLWFQHKEHGSTPKAYKSFMTHYMVYFIIGLFKQAFEGMSENDYVNLLNLWIYILSFHWIHIETKKYINVAHPKSST